MVPRCRGPSALPLSVRHSYRCPVRVRIPHVGRADVGQRRWIEARVPGQNASRCQLPVIRQFPLRSIEALGMGLTATPFGELAGVDLSPSNQFSHLAELVGHSLADAAAGVPVDEYEERGARHLIVTPRDPKSVLFCK